MSTLEVKTTLNIRLGAGEEHEDVGNLPAGTQIEILGPAVNGYVPFRVWAAAAFLGEPASITEEKPTPTPSTGLVPINQVLEKIFSLVNTEYSMGAEIKPGADLTKVKRTDCSETMEAGCRESGVRPTMPDGAMYQYFHCHKHGTVIPVAQALKTPGALLFKFSEDPLACARENRRPRTAHVAILVEPGETFEARSTESGVGFFDDANEQNWTHAALIPGAHYTGQVSEPPPTIPAFFPRHQVNIRPEEIPLARARFPVFRATAATFEFPAEVHQAMSAELGPDWLIWILMGIDSRESWFGLLLNKEGLGDGGHGHGEMQIDDRSHAAFCASGKWRGLSASLEYVRDNVLLPSFNYLSENFELFNENYAALLWATVSAYNCGMGNVKKAVEGDDGLPGIGDDIDERTASHNYARDVRGRALALKEALSEMV